LILCGALASCAVSSDDTEAESGSSESALTGAARPTQLRVVHASATSAAFDIYAGADAAPAFTNVAFGAATTYLAVPAGATQLAFRAAGAATSVAPLFTTDVTVNQGETVTAVAAGLLGSTLETSRFRVQGFVEQFGAARRREARLRFVQASHGLPAAGFDVNDDGAIEINDLPAFASSDAAGVLVQRATPGLQLAIASGTPAARSTAFTVPASFTSGGDGAFVVLAGLPSVQPREARGLALIVVGHSETAVVKQNPTVFVMPVIPDQATVNLAAGRNRFVATPIATGAAFASLSSIQVPPSDRGLALVVSAPEACGEPIAVARTGALVAGERYLAVASGFASGIGTDPARPAVQIQVLTEGFTAPLSGPGYLRAVAASPGAPLLDVGRFPPGASTAFVQLGNLTGLAYGTASAAAGVQAPATPLNPGIRPTGTTSALRFSFSALTTTDRAFGVVAGAWTPAAGEVGPRFVVVKTPPSGAWTAQALSPL
jgi:hypothetical protein